MLKLEKRGENGASPSFALAPTLKVTIFFLRHNKDGGYNSTNITGAPNENIVQNHLSIALLNVF